MSKQPPPAPTASAVGPCPTVTQIVERAGTGSLPSTRYEQEHRMRMSTLLQLLLENSISEKGHNYVNKIGLSLLLEWASF